MLKAKRLIALCLLLSLAISNFASAKDHSREDIVKEAVSHKGEITYLWGGKPVSKEAKALDCSGFIQYVFWNVCDKRFPELGSTLAISQLKKISKKKLQIGDLGMIYDEGSCYIVNEKKFYEEPLAEKEYTRIVKKSRKELKKVRKKLSQTNGFALITCKEDEIFQKEQAKRAKSYRKKVKKLKKVLKETVIERKINHVGIYCGKKNGKEIWCHCSSSGGGVVVSKGYKKFKHYYSIGGIL